MRALRPMTQEERDFAEQHHNLVIDFLRYRRLPMDEFYDVVIFGYLSAVQQYIRNPPVGVNFKAMAFRAMKDAVLRESECRTRAKRCGVTVGLDAYSVFARSLMDVNNRVLRTVKGRTHFISCAYYCCLAVQYDVSQDEINRTLVEFFSGHPSTSPEYNHTVSAGSAKPTSVQARRDAMRSLLPATDEVEVPDPEDVDPDNVVDSEQFEEEEYAV